MYPITNEVKALFEAEQKQILRITGGEKSPVSKSVGPSAMASFSDAIAADALNLFVDITPVQSGSGDPSPTNVRPISGWTGVKVTVSPSQNAQDGTTYDITFPTEAGTVYGGTLDVTTGLLTVERVMDEFDGSSDEAWRKFGVSSASAFAMFVPREHFHESSNEHIKANYLNTTSQSVIWANYDNWISANSSSGFITGIKSITDVDLWKAYLSQNPLQVCYQLATPITYQLTPTQIALLEGVNNVWADCGDVTVEYATGYEYEINITDADVVIDSFNIDRFSCIGNKLEIGTATSAQMTVKLDNHDGRFNGIVFEGTELFVEIGIADWTQSNPTINWIPCGYFTPDEQPRSLNIITIHALDRMMQFDATMPTLTPWVTQSGDVMTDSQGNIIYFVSNVQFPVTVQNLVKRVALLCGVPFTQSLSTFPNYNYTISALPTLQQEITFRNIIQWCAGIMGANAWIDWTGSLRFSWYGATTGYTSTTANRFSSDLHEDDITITGVQYTNTQNVTFVSGAADYAIDMTGNYLAATGIDEILPNVKNIISGFTYRPFTASVINAPYLWPMDIITFNKDGVNHTCAVTNVNFGINGATALESKGETAQTNSGTAPSGVTKEQMFLIEQTVEVTRKLDESLDQESIFNRLTDNGETQGLILHNGKVYLNASYIQTGTLVADFIKGGTLTLGGANNNNGVLSLIDSNGAIISTLDNNGILMKYRRHDGMSYWDNIININKVDGFSFYVENESTGSTQSIAFDYDGIDINSSLDDGTTPEYSFAIAPPMISLKRFNTGRTFIGNLGIDIDCELPGNERSVAHYYDREIYLNDNGTIIIDAKKNGVQIGVNFSVSGTKSRVVSTDQYSDRLLYCYETPSPMFGDVGEGTIGEDGKCYVWLDPVFAQTITTTQYQVFLQRYGSGECWVSERKGNYFVVEGTHGMAFGWELKAKQRDFDQRRLERNDEPFTVPKQTYGEDAAKHIEELRKERISA